MPLRGTSTSAAALLSYALICDRVYHARHVCLSVAAKAERDGPYNAVSSNIMFPLGIATMPTYVGFVVLGVAVLLGQMVFPAWLAVFAPVNPGISGSQSLRPVFH